MTTNSNSCHTNNKQSKITEQASVVKRSAADLRTMVCALRAEIECLEKAVALADRSAKRLRWKLNRALSEIEANVRPHLRGRGTVSDSICEMSLCGEPFDDDD